MICPHCYKEIETRQVLEKRIEDVMFMMRRINWDSPRR